MIVVGLVQWKSVSTDNDLVVGSAISDMYVEKIKKDHENYYALLKSHDPQNNVGLDAYFNEPRWLRIADDSLMLEKIEEGNIYLSISIRFVIPKSIARSREWIDSDTLSIELFLRDEAYNPDYLWIEDTFE